MKKVLILILIILISGCISGPVINTGSGLTVNSFTFSPTKVPSGQLTILSLVTQNLGTVDVKDVIIHLDGLSTGKNEWEITNVQGANEIEGPTKLSINSIKAVDQELELEGETKVIIWTLRSPQNLPRDEVFSYNALARVCYSYQTTATAKVEIVSEEQWLLSQQVSEESSKVQQHQIELTQTPGPLQISIDSMQPLIASDDGKVRLDVHIENIGGGTIMDKEKSCENYLKQSEALEALNTIRPQGLEVYIGSGNCNTEDQSLYFQKGKSARFIMNCEELSSGGTPKQTLDLNIKFNYKYYIDSTATVSVKGTEEFK